MANFRIIERNDGKFAIQQNVGIGFRPDNWVNISPLFNTEADVRKGYKQLQKSIDDTKIKRVLDLNNGPNINK